MGQIRSGKTATVYAFVDLDGDGQNELLMGDQSNRSGYYISGIYMLFHEKQIAALVMLQVVVARVKLYESIKGLCVY